MNQTQSQSKLSISLTQATIGQSQSPAHKINQSQGNEKTTLTKKQQLNTPYSLDMGKTNNPKSLNTKQLNSSVTNYNQKNNNYYQSELLKLMSTASGSQKRSNSRDNSGGESVQKVKKIVQDSLKSGENSIQQKKQRIINQAANPIGKQEFQPQTRATTTGSLEKKISLSPTIPGYYIEVKNVQSKGNNRSLLNATSFVQSSNNPSRFFGNEQHKKTKSYERENKDIFTVILHYQKQRIRFQIDANKTTDQLEQFLIREVQKLSLHNHSSSNGGSQTNLHNNKVNSEDDESTTSTGDPKVVSFTTIDRNLQYDYYLSLKGRPLKHLKGQTLNLQPMIYEEDPKYSGRVTLKDFIFLRCIGVGGFSRVYLVKKKCNGRFYAMKLIDKEFIIKNKKQGIVQNERDIMTVLDHPFIIKLENSFECRNYIVFVLEFCSGGELFFWLRQCKKMNENQARFYFSEICLGMLYLHSLNVVYRDIKPENILIDIDGHVRIADFGLSKPNMGEEDYAYSFCGSPEYMAPEMLLKVGHNIQVDHYCLGALLYELVTGLPPYYSRDTNKIYESILNEDLTFPDSLNLSTDIKNLLTGLLTKQPESRLGVQGGLAELLTHPWFKGTNFIDILDRKISPPFIPNQLKFNFDQSDLSKGEVEARDKLLGRTGLSSDIRLFQSFYFDPREQGKLKKEQIKILDQHKNFVAQQQAILQARTVINKPRGSTKSTSNKKKQESPQLRSQGSTISFNDSLAKQSTITKRIQQQNIVNNGLSSPQHFNQIKPNSLKRIVSQNNLMIEHQHSVPSQVQPKIDTIPFDVKGSKQFSSIPTESSEYLAARSMLINLHKRVSSMKTKKQA